MWSCMPTRPGITVRPVRSRIFALAGGLVESAEPKARILPLAMTSVDRRGRRRRFAVDHATWVRPMTGASSRTKGRTWEQSWNFLRCCDRGQK